LSVEKVRVASVQLKWNRHPGLDPGSTFLGPCLNEEGGYRIIPDLILVRHDGLDGFNLNRTDSRGQQSEAA
jgi:hypothetical protein